MTFVLCGLLAEPCLYPAAPPTAACGEPSHCTAPSAGADCLFLPPPPQGTISVGIDATDLFDRYEEEYEDVPGSSFPQIEINKMHISQSIEVCTVRRRPLTAVGQGREAQH